MLARLDEELAPARAAVNREGSLLRVEGVPKGKSASTEGKVTSTVAAMGYLAEPRETPPQDVPRWYPREEVEELSAEEARVLAERLMAELKKEGLLEEGSEQAATGFLEETLLTGFRKAAERGEIQLEWFIPPEEGYEGLGSDQRETLIDFLRRKAGSRRAHS